LCTLPPRCVKCPELHHFSVCTKDKNSPPICVNCNENHPAKYKGCKVYKQIKNHSKVKSHGNPAKHLQVIPKPQEHNSFQPQPSPQINNLQNDSYAGKVKKNISKNETTTDDQTSNTNITNDLIKSKASIHISYHRNY